MEMHKPPEEEGKKHASSFPQPQDGAAFDHFQTKKELWASFESMTLMPSFNQQLAILEYLKEVLNGQRQVYRAADLLSPDTGHAISNEEQRVPY